MEDHDAERRLPEDESPSRKRDKETDHNNPRVCPSEALAGISPSLSSFAVNESDDPARKPPLDVNSDDASNESTAFQSDPIQPPPPPARPRLPTKDKSTQTPSSSNQNQNQLVPTSAEGIIVKDADNNEIVSPQPQEIPQARETRTTKIESCPSLHESEKSELSSMGSSDSTTDEERSENSDRNLLQLFTEFIRLENLGEAERDEEVEESKIVDKFRPELSLKRQKSRRSSSSLIFTVHASDSHLPDLESSSSDAQTRRRKLLFQLDQESEDEVSEDSSSDFLLKDSQVPTKRYDKRFLMAWKMSDLYHRSRKVVVDTPIPLTGTTMFTHRISIGKRFCRRLKASSLCCCFGGESTLDGLTRQESIEAFHNEIQGLGAEERPEGNVATRRRANLIEVTKSMKLVQQMHNRDQPRKKRVSR